MSALIAEFNDPATSRSSEVSRDFYIMVIKTEAEQTKDERGDGKGERAREGKNKAKNKGKRCKNIKIKVFSA